MSSNKVAVRDDDCSYWTMPDELESVYGKYWERGIKVSFSVIPYAYALINRGNRKEMYHSDEARYIYENRPLVEYLKEKIKLNQIEIMQHGYDHSYHIVHNGNRKFLSKDVRDNIKPIDMVEYLPECIHKDDSQIKREICEGKEILEDTFGIKVGVFVPPSNAIRSYVVEEVAGLGMNISGTMTPAFNRKKTVKSVKLYLDKTIWHIKNKEVPYPFLMDYGTHKELAGTTVSPSTNKKSFSMKYEYCKQNNIPFVLATHYWELNEDEATKQYFDFWVEKLLEDKNRVMTMSEVLV